MSYNNKNHRSQLPIQYKNLNKTQTDTFRHAAIMKSSQYLKNSIIQMKNDSQLFIQEKCQENVLYVHKNIIDKTISIYQWRYKTCYPIIKPIKLLLTTFTGTLGNNNIKQKQKEKQKQKQKSLHINNNINNINITNINSIPHNYNKPIIQLSTLDQNIFQLNVEIQKVLYRLSEIQTLSTPQLFYLFKEMLIGLQCLVDIFGYFQPTQKMIIVNQQYQWRFWITENYYSNSKKDCYITEKEFLIKIIQIVENKVPSYSKVGLRLFTELKQLSLKGKSLTFLTLIDLTNTFISLNKIMVAKKFVPSTSSNSKLLNNKNDGSRNQLYFRKNNRTINQLNYSFKNLINYNQNERNQKKQKTINYEIQNINNTFNNSLKIKKLKSFNSNNIQEQSYQKVNNYNYNSNKLLTNNKSFHYEGQVKNKMKISEFSLVDNEAQKQKQRNILKKTSLIISPKNTKINSKLNQNYFTKIYQISQTFNISEQIISPMKSVYNINNQQDYQLKMKTDKKLRRQPSIERQRKLSMDYKQKQNVNVKLNNCNLQKNVYNININVNRNKIQNKQQKQFNNNLNKIPSQKVIIKKPSYVQIKKFQILNREQHSLTSKQIIRGRKNSEHVPKIKSLDQFARKNKKMCQSSYLNERVQQKNIKYGNLKLKDIFNHTRNATITGMAFGNVAGLGGTKNYQKDKINGGKFQEIIQKANNNQEQEQQNQDFFDMKQSHNNLTAVKKRRATAFQSNYSKDQRVRKNEQIKEAIKISNTNNQTTATLNQSQLRLIKTSNQSNSLSNNVNGSDGSNQKNGFLHSNHQGIIRQSNLSIFSYKTYQPNKKNQTSLNLTNKKKQNTRPLASSQHSLQNQCFQNTHEYYKNNNWNKKISGLFSDVQSIKMLKESSHFGDQLEHFHKAHLKDVKLQKLDKLGKQLKGSIIQNDQVQYLQCPKQRQSNRKSISSIGQVQECQSEAGYLEYSSSMINQEKNQESNLQLLFSIETERSMKLCQSIQQELD